MQGELFLQTPVNKKSFAKLYPTIEKILQSFNLMKTLTPVPTSSSTRDDSIQFSWHLTKLEFNALHIVATAVILCVLQCGPCFLLFPPPSLELSLLCKHSQHHHRTLLALTLLNCHGTYSSSCHFQMFLEVLISLSRVWEMLLWLVRPQAKAIDFLLPQALEMSHCQAQTRIP